MKKLYLICILILVFLSLKSISQTDEIEIGRINEPTLSFTSIDNFGFVYKLEQKNNWYWRFLFLYGRQAKQEKVGDDYNQTNSYFIPGVGIGFEKRFQIVKKLQFKTGADLIASYGKWEETYFRDPNPPYKSNSTYSSGQFNLVFGINYFINQHILLSLEFTPYVRYSVDELKWNIDSPENEHEQKSSELQYSFTNQTVSLNISYRFWRNKKNN